MTTTALDVEGLAIRSDGDTILKPLSLKIEAGEILAIIGPAGSGKTTFLRALNRLIDLDKGLQLTGQVHLKGQSLYGSQVDVVELRSKVGIVFSTPTPLPLTIHENLAFGPRLHGITRPQEIRRRLEKSLRSAYLWDEVKDRLQESALNLSGGQQQRLCLARTLMLEPEVLLLDEPCSGLDPISTAKIEAALQDLKKDMAIVLVTNNVKQASRVSDKTGFLLMGEWVEYGPTDDLFTNPKDKRTEAYVTGRFG